jgi:hypothetical protein
MGREITESAVRRKNFVNLHDVFLQKCLECILFQSTSGLCYFKESNFQYSHANYFIISFECFLRITKLYKRTQHKIISSVLECNLAEIEHMDVQVVSDTNHTPGPSQNLHRHRCILCLSKVKVILCCLNSCCLIHGK